jgi:signal transduction histidine kinase
MAIDIETAENENGYPGFHRRVLDDKSQVPAVADSLAGFIYHDLRLPLTAILAYSELMAEDDLDRLQRKDFHKEIRLAICRMNDLISLLLESSRGPEALRPEPNDIREIVGRAIHVIAVRPEFSRIVITYEHEGLNEGRFDAGQLQRVIANVVLNACEAVSAASGRIEVKSRGRRNRIEISIKDNGPGIPEPIRHAIFQPFVSYGKSGGTGLGLAIVQKILRDRGGDIFLDPTGQDGPLFRVVLPYTGSHCRESRVRPALVLKVCDQRI